MSGRVDVAAYIKQPTRDWSSVTSSGYATSCWESDSLTCDTKSEEYGSELDCALPIGPFGRKRSL